ncbi:S24 family peptidase [Nitrosophilus kaiyonis]|uniref:S24 family peptidase n=1 Tax=Nitrosophilus kaiyonis TaxID=2930200 RepID=UPI0024900384|nr:S24 family peptidase [Nitrosophilus kaiyonis]
MNWFAKNLRYYMDKKKITGEQLAKKLGVATPTVIHWANGRRFPRDEEMIRKIAEVLGVTEQDLFNPSKKLQILKEALKNPTKETLDLLKSQYPAIAETIEVPILNHEVSAGHGIEPFETEVVDKLIIDKDKLLPQYPPERLEGLQVRGNSMEPYVRDGDFVIIYRYKFDEPIEKIDNIYVINYDNQLMVKQIQFVGGSKIRIVSINPTYPPIELDMENNQVFFAIVGRVVLRILKG